MSHGNEFFLLRLPNITEVMMSNAVSFISNKCFYYDVRLQNITEVMLSTAASFISNIFFYYDVGDGKKTYLHLPAVTVKKKCQ